MTIHWIVRVISLVGIAATFAAYFLITKAEQEGTSAAVPVPSPAESTDAPPEWKPPVNFEATTARAAFLGTLGGPVGDIPGPARAAYDRAAQVMNAADSTCHLHWTLLAGVGWVETQHGSRGGSALDPAGTMTIPLFGPALSATDTDTGSIDERDDVDRPVGPLQFMPRVWAAVGVDADGDERRDPQDINDASLGLAVFLCAGSGDLNKHADAVARLESFNTVEGYAPAVLGAADRYSNTTPDIDDLATDGSTGMVLIQDPGSDPSATPSPTPSASASPRSSPSPTRPPSPPPVTSPVPTPTTTATAPKPAATPTPNPTSSPAAVAPSVATSPG